MSKNFLNHPRIKPDKVEARLYQQLLFGAAVKENILLVLPTGLGKTVIVVMLFAYFLDKYPDMKLVMTAPTRPLIEQHVQTMESMLQVDPEFIISLSGTIPPPQRKGLWKKGKILITTPQTLRNDIISNTCDLKSISFLCIDEAHRLVGEDSTVLIAEQYRNLNPGGKLVGITASPGSKEKILEIIKHLGATNVEFMNEDDHTVKPYVHETKEDKVIVHLPEDFEFIFKNLKALFNEMMKVLIETDVIKSKNSITKTKLIALTKELNKERGRLEDDEFFAAMSAVGHALRISHALEVLETQGVPNLYKYFEKQKREYQTSKKNSLRKFMNLPHMPEVIDHTRQLFESGVVHPKLDVLIQLVEKEFAKEVSSKVLVFTNYRDTAKLLSDYLNKIEIVNSQWFVGQKSSSLDQGLKQREQVEILNRFKTGDINVLVSTSVGEEGLDVSQCDLVIFYDIVPSATRLIQRTGRTGRARKGRVIFLIAKGTRDEGYYYASQNNRERLKNEIEEVKSELNSSKQTGLTNFFENQGENKDFPSKNEVIQDGDSSSKESNSSPMIIMDLREKGSSVVRHLLNQEINLNVQQLDVADYILSKRVAVERKTVEDFTSTLIREDLFPQLLKLKQSFSKPILVIEGSNLYSSTLSQNSIRGTISSILVDLGIPILFTENEEETALYLERIAKREQKRENRTPRIKSTKGSNSMKEEQLKMISSISHINLKTAENLLNEFLTLRNIANQNQDELRKVRGIGKKLANDIELLFTTPFDESGESL